jgi:hypothetical protein
LCCRLSIKSKVGMILEFASRRFGFACWGCWWLPCGFYDNANALLHLTTKLPSPICPRHTSFLKPSTKWGSLQG